MTQKILMIAAIVLVIVLIAVVLWLPSLSMGGKRHKIGEVSEWEARRYDTSFYDELEKTDYTVKADDGYVLHAELLKNPKPSNKYVIISHGYTDNRMGDLKYVQMYLDLGFNCIIYDLRGHGENEKTFTTYGIREGKDLDTIIKDTRKRYPDISEVGLHGESLGAATTITCLKYKPDIDFAVADCGFAEIESVLRGVYKQVHAPSFLVDVTDIGARLRYHYAIKDMRPIDSLDDNEVPILFIHGSADVLIDPQHSYDMAERTKGRSEVHIIKGAQHAGSMFKDPEQYRAIVKEFLESLDKKEGAEQ